MSNINENVVSRLERIREATLALRCLQEEYRAMQPSPAPARLDGMPRGTGCADGVSKMVDARSLLADRIARSSDTLAQLLCEVRPELDALPEQLFAFCLHYYVNAVPMAEAARAMQRDKKTLYEYKKRLRTASAGSSKRAVPAPSSEVAGR